MRLLDPDLSQRYRTAEYTLTKRTRLSRRQLSGEMFGEVLNDVAPHEEDKYGFWNPMSYSLNGRGEKFPHI